MKKFFSSLILANVAMAVLGCNAGETPVTEVQIQKTAPPSNAVGGGTNIPESARSKIPDNAIAPPPQGG
jgi:hypothetical protein